MFMCEIRHLFPYSPLSSTAKMVFLDCQGMFLHIPMGEHLIHRYAKNKKISLWRCLLHPDLKASIMSIHDLHS